MPNADLIKRIIRRRRSIFPPSFSDKIVDEELIHEILESANWAPTHRKTEPWRFHIITGASKQPLIDYASRWYQKNTDPAHFSSFKLDKIAKNINSSSHIIAIVWHSDPSASVPEWEEIAAIGCAVQNMWLHLSERGIGGYWSTPDYALESGKFLKLHENEKCLGWFYLGVPREDAPLIESSRNPIEDKLTWHK